MIVHQIEALRDAGVSRHDPAIRKSLEWLLSKEVKHPGDWKFNHPKLEPGGWFFEFNNEFYPDVDDTSMVLIAFGRCLPEGLGREWTMELFSEQAEKNPNAPVIFGGRSATAEQAIAEMETAVPMIGALRRGVNWLKAMQSKDGGWGAFDADNTREVLTKVPFADHNAMIDPSTADITARVLESFAAGIPCAMTAIAAEGIALPSVLRALVAESAEDMARIILTQHRDEAANLKAAKAGLALITAEASEKRVLDKMAAILPKVG
jgi:squalene cyclase